MIEPDWQEDFPAQRCNHDPNWRCESCNNRPDHGRQLDQYDQLSHPPGESITTIALSTSTDPTEDGPVEMEICESCRKLILSILSHKFDKVKYP